LLKDLVKEAKDAGLKIGFYYSQNLDWMQEGGMGNIPELKDGMYPISKVEHYVNTIVVPHIQELTCKYDIDVFWFDVGSVSNSNPYIGSLMLDALFNSPVGGKIIYNDRLLTGFNGNFNTPETDTPNIPYNGFSNNRAWEACSSLNNSWGFEYEPDVETAWNRDRWKTGYYIISRLLEIASKGGNFLLNVGPDRHGNIPNPALNTLQEVGEWMKVYGETVYGTERNNLIYPFEYGYVTQKTESDGSVHWYLHISPSYFQEKEIVVNGIADLPLSASWFDSKEPVAFYIENNNLILSLKNVIQNNLYVTIDLHFQQLPTQVNNFSLRDNKIRLTPYQATTFSVEKRFIPYSFSNWFYNYSQIEFNIYLEKGKYSLDAEYACWYRDGELYFEFDGDKYTADYKNTGNPIIPNDINNYINVELIKEIDIPVSKIYSIKIQRNAGIPNITNWINIRNFTLKKSLFDGIKKIDLLIYPIFVKDGYLTCESPDIQSISIYDAMGRLRKTDSLGLNKKVDMNMFEPGVYLIKGDNFTQKIVL